MKKKLKKLTLSRETLAGLTAGLLVDVGGVDTRSNCSWCATCESCTGVCCY